MATTVEFKEMPMREPPKPSPFGKLDITTSSLPPVPAKSNRSFDLKEFVILLFQQYGGATFTLAFAIWMILLLGSVFVLLS